MKDCCYQCPRRKVGCHAACPDYAEFKDTLKKVSDTQKAERQAKSDSCDLAFNRMNHLSHYKLVRRSL